jgi:hypothetical protein
MRKLATAYPNTPLDHIFHRGPLDSSSPPEHIREFMLKWPSLEPRLKKNEQDFRGTWL